MKSIKDVTVYYDRSTPYPAINVKVYNFPSADVIKDKFNCDDATAEAAIGFAWDAACESFWNTAGEVALDTLKSAFAEYLTRHETFDVFSLGRSGGWLVVNNLPDIEDWTAAQVSAWATFEKRIKTLLSDTIDVSRIVDMVNTNQWYKPGSEAYNFVDKTDGTQVSIPDLKAQAIKDGYGDIIR